MAGPISSAWGAGGAIWTPASGVMPGSRKRMQHCKLCTWNMAPSGQPLRMAYMAALPNSAEQGTAGC